MLIVRTAVCLLTIAWTGSLVWAQNADRSSADCNGLWDVPALSLPPEHTWGERQGLVQQVYYKNEPYQGRPTRVFAYVARPEQGDGPFPGIVLVHGGGGTAFPEWATLWAERGYVAIAMDLAGCGPNRERLADGGPDQDTSHKFGALPADGLKDHWSYHAVAAVIRAHSLLRSLREVDAERTAITGISWGGYLTCLVPGVDHRFKAAVPVYGCGYYEGCTIWREAMQRMSGEDRARWTEWFDPSRYLPCIECPMLFVNGTNDKTYPMDIYQKSYDLVGPAHALCIRVRMRHNHPDGWAPQEIGLFIDCVLERGAPLATIEPSEVIDGMARASFKSQIPVASGELNYTTDVTSDWPEREWKSAAATIEGQTVSAKLPTTRPLIYFLNIVDERGALVSTRHVEIAAR